MQTGGEFWGADVRHFNGGLFDSDRALDLTAAEAQALLGAARLNWSKVEPAIFGTLFEHSLDSGTRGKRGAHYTPVQDILDVTVPVVLDPLRAEWDAVKDNVRTLLGGKAKDRLQKATAALQAFHERLADAVLTDPQRPHPGLCWGGGAVGRQQLLSSRLCEAGKPGSGQACRRRRPACTPEPVRALEEGGLHGTPATGSRSRTLP